MDRSSPCGFAASRMSAPASGTSAPTKPIRRYPKPRPTPNSPLHHPRPLPVLGPIPNGPVPSPRGIQTSLVNQQLLIYPPATPRRFALAASLISQPLLYRAVGKHTVRVRYPLCLHFITHTGIPFTKAIRIFPSCIEQPSVTITLDRAYVIPPAVFHCLTASVQPSRFPISPAHFLPDSSMPLNIAPIR